MDNQTPNKIIFRVFRAVDDTNSAKKYIEGHMHVLKIFGITQITSAKTDWINNPNMYVILVESEDGEKVYAGSRIQIADNKFPLPIEDAIGKMDPNIYRFIKENIPSGTGEFCGLWNSREVAGMGIGSIYLGRASIALANILKIKSLYGLCAPSTLKNSLRTGFEVLEQLGDKGKFYYPKEDLLATALIIKDTKNLPNAVSEEREYIQDLSNNPEQIKIEKNKFGEMLFHFNLKVNNNL